MSIGPLHAEARTRTLTGVQILGTGRYLPDNVITNHDLMGKIWVADFVYTTCPGPCPLVTASMAKAEQRSASIISW